MLLNFDIKRPSDSTLSAQECKKKTGRDSEKFLWRTAKMKLNIPKKNECNKDNENNQKSLGNLCFLLNAYRPEDVEATVGRGEDNSR